MRQTIETTHPIAVPSIAPGADGPAAVSVERIRVAGRKRCFDLCVAVPAAVLTLPLTLALAAWSLTRFRRMPFFMQPRLGHGGEEFSFWKIRTLPAFAPETADKYQLAALDLSKSSQVVRYRHLDEFPQLFLVIAGKMSLVGPRPEMPTLSASFDKHFVAERLSVRPGCTGLWQVSTSARNLIGENPTFDLHYVHHWTLRLDVWVAYRTVLAMGFANEIVSVDDIPRWTGAAVRS